MKLAFSYVDSNSSSSNRLQGVGIHQAATVAKATKAHLLSHTSTLSKITLQWRPRRSKLVARLPLTGQKSCTEMPVRAVALALANPRLILALHHTIKR